MALLQCVTSKTKRSYRIEGCQFEIPGCSKAKLLQDASNWILEKTGDVPKLRINGEIAAVDTKHVLNDGDVLQVEDINEKIEWTFIVDAAKEKDNKWTSEIENLRQDLETELKRCQQPFVRPKAQAHTKLTMSLRYKPEVKSKINVTEQAARAIKKRNSFSKMSEDLEKMKVAILKVDEQVEEQVQLITLAAFQPDSVPKTDLEKILQAELECGVCCELLITATTLNCGHSFCRHCLNQWKVKTLTCPLCRSTIASENRSHALDNLIERLVDLLGQDSRRSRKKVIKERKTAESAKVRPLFTPVEEINDWLEPSSVPN